MVSIFVVRALIETVEAKGASRSEFCARAGLSPGLLEDAGARLDLEQFEHVVVAASATTGTKPWVFISSCGSRRPRRAPGLT